MSPAPGRVARGNARGARVEPRGLGGPSIIASDRVYPFGIASLNDRSSRD
jgi:hypothetical protein